MKLSDKWKVLSNDGDTVSLHRETNEATEESELRRPYNTTPTAWRELWKVGAEFGNDEFHDRVRFEAVRRKPVGVLTASEAGVLGRWNRPAPIRKQCEDLMEQIRTYLAHVNETDLVGYSRMVYLRNAAKNPELAAEYAALASMEDVYRFIDKCENGAPRDTESLDELLKRAEHEGFWKGRQ